MASMTDALRVGFWVALTLKPDAAPLRCYVGVVQDVDDSGVRITLVDWLTGEPSGHDFFAPWSSVTSALVATPDDNLDSWSDAAKRWQAAMSGEAKPM